MKLGELKKSLAKFPPDMDDMEVIVRSALDGKDIYENLCFTAYCPFPKHECIILGVTSTVQKLVEEGKIEKPNGYDNIIKPGPNSEE